MLNRAYSILQVKAVDVERRVITGMATTPDVDRVGDVIEPKGAKFASALPLLLFHDHTRPVGTVKLSKPTDDGIEFTAKLPTIDEPGSLRDRVEEAWQSIRLGLVKGVSIGFRVLEDGIELMRSGGVRFTKIEILELSLVSVPANAAATIASIKSIDAQHLAATGTDGAPSPLKSPGVSGSTVRIRAHPRGGMAKTITERKQAFVTEKAAKVEKMNALMGGDEGSTLDVEQQEEFDTLSDEIKALDGQISRLDQLERLNVANVAVVNGATPAVAADSRSPVASVVSVKSQIPQGIGLARYVMAGITARKAGCSILEMAKHMWPSDDRLHAFVTKATVPAGLTTNSDWMGNLVDHTNLASEFIEYLRPMTLVDRIQGLNRVPFNVRVTGQTTGAVANWVGQGKGKPVTSFSTTAITLGITKIAAIAVITEELARLAVPSAENLVRNELARAVIERMDNDFIDPATAEVANVNPASITNGLTAMTSAGTSADNVRTDLQNLLEAFILANMNANNVVLLMPTTLALAASLLTNAFGQPEFPTIGINGGTLRGVQVITSQYLANQSGAGNLVVALDPSQIFLADDGSVTVDVSREASLQMSDAPTVDASNGTGASLVSMWQTNSIAVRAERFINWKKARATAVVYMDDVNWGSIGSPS